MAFGAGRLGGLISELFELAYLDANDRPPECEPFSLSDLAQDVAQEFELAAEEAGVAAALRERGIGGIANRDSVKCLHLHYAHHLARGSAIGAEIETLGTIRICS